jgi:hypothetical protein
MRTSSALSAGEVEQHGQKAEGGKCHAGEECEPHHRTCGLQQNLRVLGGGWGGMPGEPRRKEVKEAGGPTRLSKVVAVSEVQGVEQVREGGWKGDAGERAGHVLRRKRAVTVSICN